MCRCFDEPSFGGYDNKFFIGHLLLVAPPGVARGSSSLLLYEYIVTRETFYIEYCLVRWYSVKLSSEAAGFYHYFYCTPSYDMHIIVALKPQPADKLVVGVLQTKSRVRSSLPPGGRQKVVSPAAARKVFAPRVRVGKKRRGEGYQQLNTILSSFCPLLLLGTSVLHTILEVPPSPASVYVVLRCETTRWRHRGGGNKRKRGIRNHRQ